MDVKSMLQMMSGLKPQDVARAVKEMKSGTYKNAEVLQGDATGKPSLGGLSKIFPNMLKDGTRVLTRVSTLDEVPRWLMEMDGAKTMGKVSLNPATVSDMAKKVTSAPSAKTIWETVDQLAAKGKGRKILYHTKKGRLPL